MLEQQSDTLPLVMALPFFLRSKGGHDEYYRAYDAKQCAERQHGIDAMGRRDTAAHKIANDAASAIGNGRMDALSQIPALRRYDSVDIHHGNGIINSQGINLAIRGTP